MSAPTRLSLGRLRREAERGDRPRRLIAVAFIVVALGGMLAVSASTHAKAPKTVNVSLFGSLPMAYLGAQQATAWDCPGPLPAGSAPERSWIVVTNPGTAVADVQISVAATAVGTSSGKTLPPWST